MSARCVLVAAVVVFLSVDRLPAPIEEETPSPSPSPTATATPSASSSGISPTALPRHEAARFAGSWKGKIKVGTAGEVDFTLIVNPDATSLIQKSERFGEFAHPTTVNAGALSWTAGAKNRINWTLTPNSDGQSAVVKVKPAKGEEGTATFMRAEGPPKPGRAGARPKTRQ